MKALAEQFAPDEVAMLETHSLAMSEPDYEPLTRKRMMSES